LRVDTVDDAELQGAALLHSTPGLTQPEQHLCLWTRLTLDAKMPHTHALHQNVWHHTLAGSCPDTSATLPVSHDGINARPAGVNTAVSTQPVQGLQVMSCNPSTGAPQAHPHKTPTHQRCNELDSLPGTWQPNQEPQQLHCLLSRLQCHLGLYDTVELLSCSSRGGGFRIPPQRLDSLCEAGPCQVDLHDACRGNSSVRTWHRWLAPDRQAT